MAAPTATATQPLHLLLFVKVLEETDLKQGLALRSGIHSLTAALSPQQRHDASSATGIRIPVDDPKDRRFDVQLIKKTGSYKFGREDWRSIVEANRLEEGDTVKCSIVVADAAGLVLTFVKKSKTLLQINPKIMDEIAKYPEPLFEKALEGTDVNVALTLTGTQIRMLTDFLNQEEQDQVGMGNQDFLPIIATDSKGQQYVFNLAIWANLEKYVLAKDWLKFLDNNKLQLGDIVQGWGYRLAGGRIGGGAAGELRLALNFIKQLG